MGDQGGPNRAVTREPFPVRHDLPLHVESAGSDLHVPADPPGQVIVNIIHMTESGFGHDQVGAQDDAPLDQQGSGESAIS